LRKERVLIPRPKSAFLLVQCKNCGSEQVVFSNSTNKVHCMNCNAELVTPSGGKARLAGTSVRRVD